MSGGKSGALDEALEGHTVPSSNPESLSVAMGAEKRSGRKLGNLSPPTGPLSGGWPLSGSAPGKLPTVFVHRDGRSGCRIVTKRQSVDRNFNHVIDHAQRRFRDPTSFIADDQGSSSGKCIGMKRLRDGRLFKAHQVVFRFLQVFEQGEE